MVVAQQLDREQNPAEKTGRPQAAEMRRHKTRTGQEHLLTVEKP